MARTQAQVLADLLGGKTPIGWAWNKAPTGVLAQFLAPLAAEIARFEGFAEEQTTEVDPRVAVYLLPDYERVLGPDPLGEIAVTVQQQQQRTYQRWTARGGCSIPDVIAAAAAFGVAAVVTENPRNCCGVMVCGSPIITHPEEFVWAVSMPPSTLAQAAIQQMAPAHTTVVFLSPSLVIS